MNTNTLPYLLALYHIPALGLATQKAIVTNYPDLTEFFALPARELRRIGFNAEIIQQIQNPAWTKVEEILAWSSSPQHHLLTYQDEKFPALLKEIQAAPVLLFAKGDISLFELSQLAIVGSRNPTQTGLEHAHKYSYHFAKCGIVITSGLALIKDASL